MSPEDAKWLDTARARKATVWLSRKRTSSDGFAVEIRLVQSSHLVRTPQVTACGRRMLGARSASPGYATEISRQPRVPHRTASKALHFGWRRGPCTVNHLTQNKETRPLPHCASTCSHRGKMWNGEAAQLTPRQDSAGGVPTGSHREQCTPSSPGEGHPHDTGVL